MAVQIPTPQELQDKQRHAHAEAAERQLTLIVTAMIDGRASCEVLDGCASARQLVIEQMLKKGWLCHYQNSVRNESYITWEPSGQ